MSPTFSSLRVPNYRRYAAGMLVSNTGTWMQRVAQDWLVLQLSGNDGTKLGITTALQFLPLLLFGLVGGLLADRFPKRRLLACTNTFLGLVGLTLGVLVLAGVAQVWHVYLLAFALGLGTAADNPARQAFVVEMVDRENLSNAVALNSASFNAARLVGPGIAGVAIEVFGGTGWVFILNAITFIAPLIALYSMDPRQLHRTELAKRGRGNIREGLRYVRGRPDLLAVLGVVFFAGTFGLNFQITNALMATKAFHKGAGEYGLLGSVLAIGSLAGTLLAARRKTVRLRLVLVGAAAFGITEFIAGLMPNYTWYALALPPAGMAALLTMTAANATLQLSTVPEMRGRVMSLYLMVFAGGTPLGAPVIGWLADHYGPRWSLLFGGLITATAAVVAAALLARRASMTVQAHLRPLPHLEVSRAQSKRARFSLARSAEAIEQVERSEHLHLVPAATDAMAPEAAIGAGRGFSP
ncbi:MAG TPA: MFS transporter [Sporichthyaceae bacterium]